MRHEYSKDCISKGLCGASGAFTRISDVENILEAHDIRQKGSQKSLIHGVFCIVVEEKADILLISTKN